MSRPFLFKTPLLAIAAALVMTACGGGGGGGSGGGASADGGSTGDSTFPTVKKQQASSTGNNITGAVNATNSTCTTQNGNQFDTRQAVYIKSATNGPQLPAGDYYVRVTSPKPNGDESLLGTSGTQTTITVDATGTIKYKDSAKSGCVQLWQVVKATTGGADGFDYTPNPGGVYKLWISMVADFTESMSRTDNFMVREGAPNPPVVTSGSITIHKFYDANLDGQDNDGFPIAGWKMQVANTAYQSPVTATDAGGSVTFSSLNLADYLATELKPVEVGASLPYSWYPTNVYDTGEPFFYWGVIGSDATVMNKFQLALTSSNANRTVAFGNVCVGPAAGEGGKTLGYWSNRNGANDIAAITDPWGKLATLHLVDQAGTSLYGVPFADHTAFRTWLLAGNAQNMAYMLSVQLAAMKFNVLSGKVDANAWIYADGVPATVGSQTFTKLANFMKVGDLIAVADLLLSNASLTVAGHSYRERQELTKNALDNGNNNRSFLQPTPASCPLTFN